LLLFRIMPGKAACLGKAPGSGLFSHPRGLPLPLPLLACPVSLVTSGLPPTHHKALVSSGRKTTLRLIWALSTKPKPTIMVSIEVPP
jgi:hypothetical protein